MVKGVIFGLFYFILFFWGFFFWMIDDENMRFVEVFRFPGILYDPYIWQQNVVFGKKFKKKRENIWPRIVHVNIYIYNNTYALR